MNGRVRRGFTLIELLTVIAIIAVLVAILFPVFNRAREGARQATCIANMHEMYLKTSLYKQDQGSYPPVLLGLPEKSDGTVFLVGDTGAPTPADQIVHGYLYPAYVKSIASFTCPDSRSRSNREVTNAGFPANSGFAGSATFGSHGIASADPTTPLPYYAVDSYDVTPGINSQSPYVVTYSRDWSAAQSLGLNSAQDAPNQMKYNNPPADKTVLCWCNSHVAVAGADKVPLLLLSGTARPMPAAEVTTKTWKIGE